MLSDLRLSLRALAKSPLFTFVALLTLTLGIGVNTAMFSIVSSVMLRGLPFPEADRLVHVENHNITNPSDGSGLSHLDFVDLRAGQKSFENFAAYQEGTFNLSSEGLDPERITGCSINYSGMAMLRTPVYLGRWFHADEDIPGAAPVVVLGYTVWQNRFKSDPAILGKPVKVNGEWATIVGVAPKDFRFPEESDAWKPLRYAKDEARDNRYFEAMGRLKPGVTIDQARAELQGVAKQLEQAHPDTNKNIGVTLKPLQDEFIGDGAKRMLTVMLAAVFLVMLIACANVANLLLARAAVRSKEIAVRTALGSSRLRIIRLMLGEAMVLAVGGALLGSALAFVLTQIFGHYIAASNPPYWMVFRMDLYSVFYVVGLAFVSCLLAGLWPAWRASKGDLTASLKDGGRGSTNFALSKFTRLMVIFEVVLSCVLLVLSGLYVRSVLKMQSADLGFRTAGVFTNRIGLPEAGYKDVSHQIEFYRQLLERMSGQATVESVAVASQQPTWNNRSDVTIEGKVPADERAPKLRASTTTVSENYFTALGIPLVTGRVFDGRDTATAEKVAIVSTQFAAKFWPGEDPLGKRFRYGTGVKNDAAWLTVVGIVTPTLQGQFENSAQEMPQTYTPYTQAREARFMTLFVKGRGDVSTLAGVVRSTVRSIDEDLPVYWSRTLDDMVAQAKFFKKMFAWIFGIFGGVALLLSGVGLYGVMAYSVSQRTQEIGVRMALGASSGDVLRLILREGGVRLLIGLAIGLTLAFFAAKTQTDELYGITATDVPTFLGTLLTLGFAGMLACLIPALRALRVNPMVALRGE
ncbi:ABC transporter permease [Oleiharenicola lentus]|uniref:ABC transporter permease n=1 Tax=Oleiharenicola lentus TaxID=2508720 RepID=UPI003F6731EF